MFKQVEVELAFIESFYPNYHGCHDIADLLDYLKIMDGELTDNCAALELLKSYNNNANVIEQLNDVDRLRFRLDYLELKDKVYNKAIKKAYMTPKLKYYLTGTVLVDAYFNANHELIQEKLKTGIDGSLFSVVFNPTIQGAMDAIKQFENGIDGWLKYTEINSELFDMYQKSLLAN